MSIAAYIGECALNYPGNRYLLLTEVTNLAYIGITGGEITSITMVAGTYFNQIEVAQDSLRRTQLKTGERAISYQHDLAFMVTLPRIETNILTDSLKESSPCGLAALVVDNNDKVWLVGWNHIIPYLRGLYLDKYTFSNGGLLDPNDIDYNLARNNECADLPLQSTLADVLLDKLKYTAHPIQIDFDLTETISYPGVGEITYPGVGEIIYP